MTKDPPSTLRELLENSMREGSHDNTVLGLVGRKTDSANVPNLTNKKPPKP